MYKNMIIYHHPTFGDSTSYFRTESEAIMFCAEWLNMYRALSLETMESITVVFN